MDRSEKSCQWYTEVEETGHPVWQAVTERPKS